MPRARAAMATDMLHPEHPCALQMHRAVDGRALCLHIDDVPEQPSTVQTRTRMLISALCACLRDSHTRPQCTRRTAHLLANSQRPKKNAMLVCHAARQPRTARVAGCACDSVQLCNLNETMLPDSHNFSVDYAPTLYSDKHRQSRLRVLRDDDCRRFTD